MNKIKLCNVAVTVLLILGGLCQAQLYDPSQDPSLLVWFMADQGVTTQNDLDPTDPGYLSGGTGVMIWQDQSDNGFDAFSEPNGIAQVSEAIAPNGKTVKVVTFDGSGEDYMILEDESGPDPSLMQSQDIAVFAAVYKNANEDGNIDVVYSHQVAVADDDFLGGYYIGWQPDGRPFQGYGLGTAGLLTHVQAPTGTFGLVDGQLSVIDGFLKGPATSPG